MKNWIATKPLICFSLFALLIAFRDTLTHIFLSKQIDPLVVVFIFFFVTTTLACIYGLWTQGSVLIARDQETTSAKMGLGLVTLAVFLSTMYGIKFLGASIFSLIEHCLIPISTLLMAQQLLKEQVTKRMIIGITISVISIIIFLYPSSEITLGSGDKWDWYLGIVLAIIGSALTSLSSAYQKKLINFNYAFSEILFIRFIIPCFLVGGMILLGDIRFPSIYVCLQIAFYGCIFFALPLLLLFQGFVRSSLSRFSAFNILIPAITFIVGSILIPSEISRWSDPIVLLGVAGITSGYVIFEWDVLTNYLRSKASNG